MHIELVSTGDEIVTGLVVDTNAAWLSALLLEQGWQVRRRHTVGDNLDDIRAVLQEAAARSDVVLVCGGLGPTSDDLTAAAAATAFDAPLALRPDWLEVIRARYASRGRTMPQSNAKQAWLPAGSQLLDNPVGTACGFRLTVGECRLYFTPGVPFEFRQMVQTQILTELGATAGATTLRRFYTFGVPESFLSDRLDPMSWPAGVVLGYRSSMPLIELKLIGHGVDESAMQAAECQLLAEIAPWLVGQGAMPPWQSILADLAGAPLRLLEGASGGALQRLCRDYPRLDARFVSQVDEAELAPGMGIGLMVGREEEQGVRLLLLADGRRFAQRVQVSHPDRASRERILAFCALDMLRRHLAGGSPFGAYQTLRQIECGEL